MGDFITPLGHRFQITKHLNLAILALGAKYFCGCFEFEALKVELDPQRTGGLITWLEYWFQITKHLNLAIFGIGDKFFCGFFEFVALKVELDPQYLEDFITPSGPRFEITKYLNLVIFAIRDKKIVDVLNLRLWRWNWTPMRGGPHNLIETLISNHETSKFSRFGFKS